MKHIFTLLTVFLIISCVNRSKLSIYEDYYSELEVSDTKKVYDTFKNEISNPIIGHHEYTNTTIILGKRGIQIINLLNGEKYFPNPYYYEELFLNMAFFSKIDVCSSHFYKKFLNDTKIKPNYDCEYYKIIMKKDSKYPYGIFDPKFVERN